MIGELIPAARTMKALKIFSSFHQLKSKAQLELKSFDLLPTCYQIASFLALDLAIIPTTYCK